MMSPQLPINNSASISINCIKLSLNAVSFRIRDRESTREYESMDLLQELEINIDRQNIDILFRTQNLFWHFIANSRRPYNRVGPRIILLKFYEKDLYPYL